MMRARLPDRYLYRGPLGAGAQGVVLHAQDTFTGRDVAIKVLRPGSPAPLARREVAALFALDLPGVVRLLDLGETALEDGGRAPMLVMEHIAGEPFPGLGRASWAAVLNPTVGLLKVLRRVHAAGVVHRDLKPEHVRLRGAEVVLLDFGAVCGPGADALGEREDGGAGDLRYMAPEQLQNPEAVNGRADLYALGVMLYEALTGQPPHELHALRGQRLRGQQRPVEALRPDLPPEAARLIDGLLQRHPEDRLADAEAALRVLGLGADQEIAQAFVHWRGPPPDTEQLEGIFHGPERIFGRRARALRALQRRSGLSPEETASELSAWIAAGRARWSGGALELSPSDLAWLDEDIALRTPPGAQRPASTPARAELHALLHLSWPGALPTLLGQAWQGDEPVEAALAALRAEGNAAPLPDGRWRATTLPHAWEGLSSTRRAELHGALALAQEPGSPTRLRHLLGAGLTRASAEEAGRSAVARARQGDVDGALLRVDLGLRVARGLLDLEVERALLRARTWISLSASAPDALRRTRYELARAATPPGELAPLVALLDAAEHARAGRTEAALAALAALPSHADENLDRWRYGLAIEATQHIGGAPFERALQAADEQAKRRGTASAWADAQGWRGLWLLGRGACAEAEGLLAKAADGKATVSGRLSVMGTRAVALLELRRFSEAVQLADALLSEALSTGLPIYAAIASWARRSAAWRQGEPLAPDWELVEAAALLEGDVRRAQIAFTEAAFAWRRGLRSSAETLATLAAQVWARRGSEAAIMAEALAAVCADPDPAYLSRLAERAARALDGAYPGLALQALGLLASIDASILKTYQTRAEDAFRALPPVFRRGLREAVDLNLVFRFTDRPITESPSEP